MVTRPKLIVQDYRDVLKPITKPVLLLGNGPSRGMNKEVVLQWAEEGWLIAACNSYWREETHDPHGWPWADYLLAYDVGQVTRACEGRRAGDRRHLLVPSSSLPFGENRDKIKEAFARKYAHELLAVPHLRSWDHTQPVPEGKVGGNLSGFLLFQVLVKLGAPLVGLLGIDCAGKVSPTDERVQLSTCESAWDGYEHQFVGTAACIGLGGGWYQPSGWSAKVETWRALTAWSEARGTPVRRLAGVGALTWVPTLQDGTQALDHTFPSRAVEVPATTGTPEGVRGPEE